MQEQINTNRGELGTLSLRDLFFKYLRFLPYFVLSVAIMLFGAYIYLRYATRIYSSSATLMIINEQKVSNDKVEELLNNNNRALNVQSEIEILKSKPLMERVVKKLNLSTSYLAIGKIKNENIYKYGPFVLDALKINDSSSSFTLSIKPVNNDKFSVSGKSEPVSFGEVFKNNYGEFRLIRSNTYGMGNEYSISWSPPSNVADNLAAKLQVVPKTVGTGILTLSIEGTNPIMCAEIINQLMAEYQQYSIEGKNEQAELTIRFVDDRMDSLGKDIDSIQKIKLHYMLAHDVIDLQAQAGIYFQNATETDKAIYSQQNELQIADYIESYLKNKKNDFSKIQLPVSLTTESPVPSSLGLKDLVLNGYIEAYNKAQMERQALLNANIPAAHPVVKQQDELIAKLRGNIQESLKNIKATLTTELNELKQKNASLQGQIKSLPLKTQEYMEILRLLESKQYLYKILQQKREETAISKAATGSNSKVINSAYVSFVAIKPSKRSIQLLAILIGLIVPALFIFIAEILNDKITTRFDIEKITPVPILGEIGHSYMETALIVNKTTRSMVAEQFRIIRSNLQYILGKTEKPVILVTSSFSGEGKSFVTTNIGAVMALAGKKTVILEFDIRKPKILSGLNMSKRPGITNFLVGNNNNLDEMIIPVPNSENLFVLSCGPVPPNPAELLLDPRIDDLFAYLKQNFDTVIIDTAPVGMVSDAMTLSKFADCTLYLVRQGHTFKKQIALIDDFYRENKLPKLSIVINDVKLKTGYGYYGYGRYGYGYGYNYSSYYDEEHGKPTTFTKILYSIGLKKTTKKSSGKTV
jgi:capsular exopolysaccharide synthesis family protein